MSVLATDPGLATRRQPNAKSVRGRDRSDARHVRRQRDDGMTLGRPPQTFGALFLGFLVIGARSFGGVRLHHRDATYAATGGCG